MKCGRCKADRPFCHQFLTDGGNKYTICKTCQNYMVGEYLEVMDTLREHGKPVEVDKQ